MSKSKLPAQLYVCAKEQPIHENGKIVGYNTPLGFLNAYEPNKSTFTKKRITQEEWAYKGWIFDFKLVARGPDHDPEYYATGWNWESPTKFPAPAVKVPVDKPVTPQPQIWNNTPLAGFRVLESVSRWSTSNKVWRILDPRGIEFEISTACMEQLIMEAGIKKGGEIDATCAWMSNKNLVAVT